MLFSQRLPSRHCRLTPISLRLRGTTFTSGPRFLHSAPGGIHQGEIGIAEVSLADWQVIGQRWGEEASQQALMRADEPCLELVQACQVLALFWFAKARATRTNMHTGTNQCFAVLYKRQG
jgi:hypothetical protein